MKKTNPFRFPGGKELTALKDRSSELLSEDATGASDVRRMGCRSSAGCSIVLDNVEHQHSAEGTQRLLLF